MKLEAAQPPNVSSVFVEGRLLKHQGEFLGLDEQEIYQNCQSAFLRLKQKVKD
jgi:hypothetical protein